MPTAPTPTPPTPGAASGRVVVVTVFGSSRATGAGAGFTATSSSDGLIADSLATSQELLDQLDAAAAIGDMSLPPSNRLHKLKGKLKGYWSVSINMKYRIIFKFDNGRATDVEIVDYH